MDLVRAVKELGTLDDQQMMQVRGSVPDYIWAGEMAKRDQMRKVEQADQANRKNPANSTVVEDLTRKFQQQQQQPPPGAMPPQGPPPPQSGAMQMMAGGGMVRRYDEGGGVPKAARNVQDWLAMVGPAMQADQAMSRAKVLMGGGEDSLAPIMAELAQQKAQPVVSKPTVLQILSQAALRNGAAMMASRNPTPLGGLGEGITAAMSGYSEDRDKYRADQVRQQNAAVQNLNQRANVAEAQQRSKGVLAQLAQHAMSDDTQTRNTMAAGIDRNLGADEDRAARKSLEQMQIDAQSARDKLQQPYHEALTRKAAADALSQEEENLLIKQMGLKSYQEWKADLHKRAQQRSHHDMLLMKAYQGDPEAARVLGLDTKEMHENRLLLTAVTAADQKAMAMYMKTQEGQFATPEKLAAKEAEFHAKHIRDLGITPERAKKMGLIGEGTPQADFTYRSGKGLTPTGGQPAAQPASQAPVIPNWGTSGAGHAKPVPGKALGMLGGAPPTKAESVYDAFGPDYSKLPESVKKAIGWK